MTYQKLLGALTKLVKSDGRWTQDVDIVDLLDDLASLGIDGASELYAAELVGDVNPEDGTISSR